MTNCTCLIYLCLLFLFLGIAGTPTTNACDYVKQLTNNQVTVEVVQASADLQVRMSDGNNVDVGDAVACMMPGMKTEQKHASSISVDCRLAFLNHEGGSDVSGNRQPL